MVNVNHSQTNDALFRRLTSVGLAGTHASTLSDCAKRFADKRSMSAIIAERGEEHRPPAFLLSGWAIRQVYLEDGARHISCFLLPGDPLFPFACIGEHFSYEIVSITDVIVVNVKEQNAATDPEALMAESVKIARQHLLFARNHMVRLGCQSAYHRVGHLILEPFDRLSQVGLTCGQSCILPVTQEMIGDALGLSAVHVNRCFKQLREAELVLKVGNRLDLLNGLELISLTDYHPIAEAGALRL